MKAVKIVLLILGVLLLIAAIAATAYFGISRGESGELLFFGMNKDEVQIYAKEEILPMLTGIATAVTTLYVAISPAIKKIRAASSNFETATAGVNSASADVKANRAHVAKIEEDLRKDMETVKNEYAQIDRKLDALEHAMLLAFTNSREHVVNGSSTEIAHILQHKEGKDNGKENGKEDGKENDEAIL